ncbi:MAG: hypothetical protein WBD99_07480 [Thermodesulfobacteriota bacterium]
MKKSNIFIRNLEASEYFEVFLVSAVSSILIIRLFLRLTGYPQIGNSNLHIAHMLWGGLLMLISIMILLFFLSRRIEWWASLFGGIGFGTFIDEVGKFVTQDNDYFFQPAVAIMYVIFILIYMAVHTIQSGWGYTKREYLVNALDSLKELALRDLDEEQKNRAIGYLNRSDPTDPLVSSAKSLLMNAQAATDPSPGVYARLKSYLNKLYLMVIEKRTFTASVITIFLLKLFITTSAVIFYVFFLGLGWERILNSSIFSHIAKRFYNISFVDGAEVLSSLASGIFVFIGIYYIRKSKLKAYQMFERSILISIFLTQVFIFYKEQFAALVGLSINILFLLVIKFMIEREKSEAKFD